MHIGILSQVYDPEPGGGVISTVLAKGLRDRGHRVTVLTGFPNYPQGKLYDGYRIRPHTVERRDGIEVHRVPLWPNHSPTIRGRVANYLSFALSASTIGMGCLRDVDAVYTFYSEATIGLPVLALRALGKPVLLHVQDLWPESVLHSGFVREGWISLVIADLIRRWCSQIYRRASEVAAITPPMRDELVARGAPSQRTTVIYNWTDESVFRPSDRPPNRAGGGETIVMYAGALGHVQALETAIRAARRVMESHPDFRLHLVGSGVAEQSLRLLSQQIGATNVVFLGPRPLSQMGALYAGADAQLISLMPESAFERMLPSKMQAAFASGSPVVVSAAGEAARIVRHAQAGIWAAPGDVAQLAAAYQRLSDMDAKSRAVMGRSARDFYMRWMSETQGLKVIESLLANTVGDS